MNISIKLHNKLQQQKEELSDIYKIDVNKDGLKIIYKNNRAIHSKYNIENECKRALENINKNKNLIIIYGYGLGYILKYLLENINNYFNDEIIKDLKIVIVVEDAAIFKYSYYNIYSTNKENIFFIDSEDDIEYINKIIDYKNINGINLVMLPSLTKEEKDNANIFYTNILNNMEKELSNILTNMYFENIWTKNIIFNSEYISKSSDVSILKDAFKDFKALLICPGPTLEYSIKKIKNNRESFIVICVDTAYSVLCKNNIIPDFVVTVDGGFFNSLDFIYESTDFPYLIMDIACNKIIPKRLENKTNIIRFSSNENLELIKYINDYTAISALNTSSTVASTMIDFAYYTGFKDVLLIGFDNSYPFYQRHIKHTLSYEYMINKTNKIKTFESYYFNTIKNNTNIDVYPPTEFVFENQIEYFKSFKDKYKNMNIKRLTYDAVKIEYIEEGNIDDFVFDRNMALNIADKKYKENDKTNIKEAFKKLKTILEEFKIEILNIYNEAKNNNDEEKINNIYDTSIKTIKTYQEKANILKTILSSTMMMSNRANSTKRNKLIFLLTETLSNVTYFLSRINIAIKKL
ncbi:motility associated factor glycosyltransferase family protein [Brachyspira pilosicoli]|uniref:motility associated factor glycosyltransferase family protein n=1 Tax=uncultured Brachyspira sp. TaxID=221953 RepID=UPI0025992D5F|nr:6-hydroxymethylpterin diphosphokinase MptE-like protein [uncultured Brachyspira sp.]